MKVLVHQVMFWAGMATYLWKIWQHLPDWFKLVLVNILALHLYHNWYKLTTQALLIGGKILAFLEREGPWLLSGMRTALTAAGHSLMWLAPEAEPEGAAASSSSSSL